MRRVLMTAMLTTLLAFGAPQLGQATDAQGNNIAYGHGLDSCSKYTATLSAGYGDWYVDWIAGYLTSFNQWHNGVFDLVGANTSQPGINWITAYCLINPLQTISQAANAMVVAFWPTRATEAPAVVLPPAPSAVAPRRTVPPNNLPVVPPPAASPTVLVSTPPQSSPRRDLIRHVQARLQTAGFSPGALDGGLGPQTRDALRWFQNAKGLPATGEPDTQTLDALGVR